MYSCANTASHGCENVRKTGEEKKFSSFFPCTFSFSAVPVLLLKGPAEPNLELIFRNGQ